MLEDLGGFGLAIRVLLPLNIPNKIEYFSRKE